jgi:hypothetical protein
VSPLDLVTSSFADHQTPMFTSALLSEFIVSIYTGLLALGRRACVCTFLLQHGFEFAMSLIIEPPFDCELGSEMFIFYLNRLADVHRFLPQMLELLFSEPDIGV